VPELIDAQVALTRARELAARPSRVLLGLAGAPAAGKSTLAAQLAASVRGSVVVPMDGFHLPTPVLTDRGEVADRGAPHTFDAAGFVSLLQALRAGDAVWAPEFDRAAGEPVPDAIAVPAHAPLVIVEGNYLLLDTPPWDEVRELLDAVWFVEGDEAARVARLVARHMRFGWSAEYSTERATRGVDHANALLVSTTRARADVVVRAE
jgi:pantothenate kinase